MLCLGYLRSSTTIHLIRWIVHRHRIIRYDALVDPRTPGNLSSDNCCKNMSAFSDRYVVIHERRQGAGYEDGNPTPPPPSSSSSHSRRKCAIHHREGRNMSCLLVFLPAMMNAIMFRYRITYRYASRDDVYDLALLCVVPYALHRMPLSATTTDDGGGGAGGGIATTGNGGKARTTATNDDG